MGILVVEIKDAVKRRFNGIGDKDFLSLFREGHRKICKRVQLYPQRSAVLTWTSSDITNGVFEWPLPQGVRRGWQARYWLSSTSSYELDPTNIHRLDGLDAGWRVRVPGNPHEFYISGGRIGLVPRPSGATDGGYPKVEIYHTGYEELGLDDELPDEVDDISAWEYYIKWKYAEDRVEDKQEAERFRQLHRACLKELSDEIGAIAARDFSVVKPYVPRVRVA